MSKHDNDTLIFIGCPLSCTVDLDQTVNCVQLSDLVATPVKPVPEKGVHLAKHLDQPCSGLGVLDRLISAVTALQKVRPQLLTSADALIES